jgi:hypothetical protein
MRKAPVDPPGGGVKGYARRTQEVLQNLPIYAISSEYSFHKIQYIG